MFRRLFLRLTSPILAAATLLAPMPAGAMIPHDAFAQGPNLAASVESSFSSQSDGYVLLVVLSGDEGAWAEICRNDPVNNVDPLGLAVDQVVRDFRINNGLPEVFEEDQEWHWYTMGGRSDYKVIGNRWRSAQGRELQYFLQAAGGWSVKDANARWAIGWQHAAQDLEPARKQFEKIEAAMLLAPVVAPVAVEAASTAQIWAYLRIAQPVAQWLNKGGWVRAGIATLLGYEITPQGRQSTAQALTAVSQSRQLILRPIEIQFPARGLSPVQRDLFTAHLAEQQTTLNQLSLTSAAELEMNLLNYQNISRELATARAMARGYMPGSGMGLDAAHSLDAVAGGRLHQFIGFRDPVQRYIGSLWRTRVDLIVPGREHRLVPAFSE